MAAMAAARRRNAGIPSATMELYAPGHHTTLGARQQPAPQRARSFFFADAEEPPAFSQAESAGFAWMAEGGADGAPAEEWEEPPPSEGPPPRPQPQGGRGQPRAARSARRRRAPTLARRPKSAPVLVSAGGDSSGLSLESSSAAALRPVQSASLFSQRSAAMVEVPPSAAVSQRDAVRAGTQRLSLHRLQKQQRDKRREQDCQDYARAQRRQLVASIRLANDCCRILKRTVSYGLSDDPMKKGLMDWETPSTLQMRVVVTQQGASQYGWKEEGEAHVREISVPLFQRELDGLQREAALEEQRRREGQPAAPDGCASSEQTSPAPRAPFGECDSITQ